MLIIKKNIVKFNFLLILCFKEYLFTTNHFKMKKTLLLFAFFLTALLNAQEKGKNCTFNYKVFSENIIEEEEEKSIYKTQIHWDFSKINFDSTTCVIEIIPIKDCVNELNAIKFKSSILISSKDENFKQKGFKSLNHIELMSKCFKWRVVITDKNTSCEEATDWKYSSFLSQK